MNRLLLPGILCASAALLTPSVRAASFTWAGGVGPTPLDWSNSAQWVGNVVPPANNITTELIFQGNVISQNWVSNNNIATVPFLLNQITLLGTDTNNSNSNLSQTIQGNALSFVGVTPEIRQSGSSNVTINNPISFTGSLLLSGDGDLVTPANGSGTVTLNAGISGIGDITKTGTSTFRFGTIPSGPFPTPSANTWMGNLIIDGGTVRFNNNAQSASSALRANPVVFTGDGILSARRSDSDESPEVSTSLRLGTLSGATGTVMQDLDGTIVDNFDIVITAITNGTFGGTIIIPQPAGGNDGGDFVVRGPGIQTLTGSLTVHKDSAVGHGATLVLAENASMASAGGGITFAGGTVKLDNSLVVTSRLPTGVGGSTTVEPIGGGTLQLIGGVIDHTEFTGRIQLGSANNPRSGHLKVEIVESSAGANTELQFHSYTRDQTNAQEQYATVEFSAFQPNGTSFTSLGVSGKNKITFSGFTVPTSNSLLNSTGTGAFTSVGWATVNTPTGTAFATYGSFGIAAVGPTNWGLPAHNATANVLLTNSQSTTASTKAANSLRILPAAGIGNTGELTLAGTDILSTTAILLAGAANYAIKATSPSNAIGGTGQRYFHVQTAELTVDAKLTGANYPVVKSGDGTLILPDTPNTAANVGLNQVVVLNGGTLRAQPGSSLPQGEIRFRGGQLEILGGGTFSRNIHFGAGSLNWTGLRSDELGGTEEVDENRGSGGFAAFGADVTIDLNAAGPSLISWEDKGFLSSGYALTFGSKTATRKVTWSDNLSLSTADLNVVNYNAREIRVHNNPATTLDVAVISGVISGRQTNDLLKTGPGDLTVSAANTYAGATIVHGGRLFVNGNSQSSFLHKVMPGATLTGNGTVGKVLVDAGGKLAPGAKNGATSILAAGDVQFTDATSIFSVQLGGPTAGGNGNGIDDVLTETIGYDQLNVTGTLTLNGADLEATFFNGYSAGISDIFFLIINDGLDPVVGQFADGNQVTIGSQTFNISYTANSAGASFTGGNDVALQLVPEPSSALLLGLGGLLVGRRRRRQS